MVSTALTRRVWGAGKVLVIALGLVLTYLVCFGIAMRVALRAREVTVPALTGRTVAETTAVLGELDLTLQVEELRRPDQTVARDLVVAQDPPAGLVTRQSRVVRVWLSDGPAITIVPALVGESERTAQMRAESGALAVGEIAEIRSSEYPAGVVIAQWPQPQGRASSVALLVNRGEIGQRYVMPDLIGVNGDRAAAVLRARGFRVAIVGNQPYPGVPRGTVIAQRPSGGFQVGAGEPISLEVSQ
jgi:serine/threonine-protein kinase